MGSKTSIEWTTSSWNPVRGCRRVSPGCANCYAEKMGGRFCGPGLHHEGLVRISKSGEAHWTGDVRFLREKLAEPLRWKRGRKIFVNSTSDLFYEEFSNEAIAAVFGVMAAAKQHTFQVLTKRAERMRDWFKWVAGFKREGAPVSPPWVCIHHVQNQCGHPALRRIDDIGMWTWPRPNIWLGVSVENQEYADRRIPALLQTPAAVRFVSYEPALGPVDFSPWLTGDETGHETGGPQGWVDGPRLDQVIVGGESGPGARPFAIEWAQATVEQCRRAGVACFVKQMGSKPTLQVEGDQATPVRLKDSKGGDMSEWEDPALRVREFPGEAHG